MGSYPGRGKRFLLLQNVQTWGPSSLLFNKYGDFFSKGKRPGRMFTTDVYLPSRFRKWVELYLYSPYVFRA